MTREEAIEVYHGLINTKIKEAFEFFAPELRESEDERVREKLIRYIKNWKAYEYNKGCCFALWTSDKEECDEILAYLEKQKEIPTDAKQERVIKAARRVLNNWLYGDVNADVSGDLTELEYAIREYDGEEKQKEQKPLDYDNELEKAADNYAEQFKDNGTDYTEIRDAYKAGAFYAKLKEQKHAEWNPQPESLEALMYAIEGKWEMIKPTSYLSRRLEDLYDGLVNTYNVDETFLAELPKTAYSAKDIEELRALKDKIEASMDEKPAESIEGLDAFVEWFEKQCKAYEIELPHRGYDIYGLCKDIYNRLNSSNTAEWSEEDEKIMQTMIKDGDLKPSEIAWLKSLRPRWKPSEDMIKALEKAIVRAHSAEDIPVLTELRDKLKAL